MPHNDTPNSRNPKLTSKQLEALASLLAGHSVTSSAQRAKVSRETVHRWLRDDFEFGAEFNRGIADRRREIGLAIERAVRSAVETVNAAIEDGDVRAALTVLKGAGFLCGKLGPVGSSDPDVLAEETILSELKRP